MAIFPIVEEENIEEEIITDRGINFLYDFTLEDFILKDGRFVELVGDAAVVFWIEKVLRTQYEISEVYHLTEYGTDLESVRGKVLPFDIAKNILKTNIEESLYKHERIKEITNFNVTQENDNVYISFNVSLNPYEPNTDITSEEGFTRLTTIDEIKDFIDSAVLITSDGFYFKTNLGSQVYLNI